MRPFFIALLILVSIEGIGQVSDSLKLPFKYQKTAVDFSIDSSKVVGPARVRVVHYPSPDKGQVTAYFITPTMNGIHPTIVFQHGSEGNRREFLNEALFFAGKGIASLLVDAPWNRKDNTYQDLITDAPKIYPQQVMDLQRGIDILSRRVELDKGEIYFVGHSFGAQLGAIMSGIEPRIKGFVLMTGAVSLTDMVRNSDNPYFVKFKAEKPQEFNTYLQQMKPFDALKYIKSAKVPIFHQFANKDEYITNPEANRFAQVTPQPSVFKFYDAKNALNDKARQDRQAFLLRKINGADNMEPYAAIKDIPFYEYTKLRTIMDAVPEKSSIIKKNIAYKKEGETYWRFNLHSPVNSTGKKPVVILVHGQSDPQLIATAKEWTLFEDYAKILTAQGLAVVTANFGSVTTNTGEVMNNTAAVAANVNALLAYLKEKETDLNIDASRMGIWAFSAAGSYGVGNALTQSNPNIKAVVAYYTFLDPANLPAVSLPPMVADSKKKKNTKTEVITAQSGVNMPPLLVVKAGLDKAELNSSIDAFRQKSEEIKAPVTFIELPNAHPNFDTIDDLPESKDAIQKTINFLKTNLGL